MRGDGNLVFVDSGVLIAAARGTDTVAEHAFDVLGDPTLRFASSLFVRLEVLPKAIHNRRQDEVDFYEAFFESVVEWADVSAEVLRSAFTEAASNGLSAMDALHVASAASVGASWLVTSEAATKPIHRAELVPVKTIHSSA